MRLKSKTTATLLIAIFMISAFAVAMPVFADTTHLIVDYPTDPAGAEDRIVIDLPLGFTLGDLKTISWFVKMVEGYPLHVDIILADDIDGLLNIDSLTAEIGENDNPDNLEMVELLADYSYGAWLKTFEHSAGVGDSLVDDDTVFWVTRLGAGCDNAPYGTLAELKNGAVTYPDDYTGEQNIEIGVNWRIERLEFEIDNWLGSAEAFVQDIKINSECGVSLEATVRPPMTSISVTPTSVDFGEIVLGEIVVSMMPITIENTGETNVDLTAELIDDDGFYTASLRLDNDAVSDWAKQLYTTREVNLKLDVDRYAEAGVHTAVLVFWAEEATG